MKSKTPKPKTITGYIKSYPEPIQKKLKEMVICVKSSAPGATEGLKWSMPSFSYKRILVTFAAFKNHIGFYPTPSAIKAFAKELSKYKTAKGSIQFPLDKPLPKTLIRNITKFRVKESKNEDVKWKSS
jgi:uncharacterized protein YdhG (YjbR/CyaY superfamily)